MRNTQDLTGFFTGSCEIRDKLLKAEFKVYLKWVLVSLKFMRAPRKNNHQKVQIGIAK